MNAMDKLESSNEPASQGFVASCIRIITEKIQKTDKRLAALEQRRMLSFEGAHDPGRAYVAGACVQRSGALHVALIDTQETPGASSAWRKIAEAKQ